MTPAAMTATSMLSFTRLVLPILLGSALFVRGLGAILPMVCERRWRQPIHLDELAEKGHFEDVERQAGPYRLRRAHLFFLDAFAAIHGVETIVLLSRAAFQPGDSSGKPDIVLSWATVTIYCLAAYTVMKDESTTPSKRTYLTFLGAVTLLAAALQFGSLVALAQSTDRVDLTQAYLLLLSQLRIVLGACFVLSTFRKTHSPASSISGQVDSLHQSDGVELGPSKWDGWA